MSAVDRRGRAVPPHAVEARERREPRRHLVQKACFWGSHAGLVA